MIDLFQRFIKNIIFFKKNNVLNNIKKTNKLDNIKKYIKDLTKEEIDNYINSKKWHSTFAKEEIEIIAKSELEAHYFINYIKNKNKHYF